MRSIKNIKYKPIILIIIFLVFLIKAVMGLDPDFGWHIRMGEIISLNGIPKTDPFSYTMPSFPFVDHEWLTNVLMEKLYLLGGNNVLSIIYSLLAVFALIISKTIFKIKEKKLEFFSYVLLLVASVIYLPFMGIRPQVISWLFLAILLKVIFDPILWQKWSIFLPIFFLLWANLHGSFGLGVLIIIFLVVVRAFREKKIPLKNVLIIVLSILATLINPYKQRLWGEFWMQVTDGSLRFKIIEWYPGVFNFNLAFLALIALSLFLLVRYRKKFLLEEIGLYLALLFGAISSLRNIPLWVIFAIPIAIKGAIFLYEEAKSFKDGEKRFNKVGKITILILLGLSFAGYIYSFIFGFSLKEDKFYPKKAIAYLKDNPFEGQLYSSYNWGGYLIWKYPQKKVFIDGRMPSWRWKNNPANESPYIMTDYIKLMKGEIPFEEVKKKYNITVVLLPKEKEQRKKENFNLMKNLQEQGWQLVYQDEVSVVLKRK